MSGLDFQTVDVKFTQGLDTKTQGKLVIPSKWNQLNNVSLAADFTPRRRDGWSTVANSATGNGLATLGNQLLVVNGRTLKSQDFYSTTTKSGAVGYVNVTKDEVRRSGGLQSGIDCASGGGLTCFVWLDSLVAAGTAAITGVNVTIIEETTGDQLFSNVQIKTSASCLSPRVVYTPAAGGGATEAFMIFYLQGTSLMCRVIEFSTVGAQTVGGEVALVTSASLGLSNFDACGAYIGATNKGAMVSYWWTDTATSVRSVHVSQTASVPAIDAGPTNVFTRAQVSDLTRLSLCCVAFSATANGTFAVATTGAMAGLAGVVVDNAWAVSAAAAQLDATVPTAAAGGTASHLTGVVNGSNVWLYSDQQATLGNNTGVFPIRTVGVTAALAITAAASTLVNSANFIAAVAGTPCAPAGPFICGKAFVSGGAVFLPTCFIDWYNSTSVDVVTLNEQNTFFLLECTGTSFNSPAVVATALQGTFGVPLATGTVGVNNVPLVSTPCSTPALSGGFSLGCPERGPLALANGINVSASGICRLVLTPQTTTPPIRAQFGQGVFFAGGQVTNYDGVSLSEVGFPLFPEGISARRNAGAGDVTIGTHQIVAVYEWTDAAGRRHQSSPSQPVSWTSNGADTATVVVPTLLISAKIGIQLVLYMTQAGGTIFNRCVAVSAPVLNVTTAESVSITLGGAAHLVADATIAGNELLYTQPDTAGTALPAFAPAPCTALAIHQNRLVVNDSTQPNVWRMSQQLVDGVGLQFNPDLEGEVPESGGGIVGFASLDEKLIIFARRKPFVVYGTGPDASGANSSLTGAQEIPSDVGCSEPRSILKMPTGVIFKSAKGWYQIGRDLVCRYIGEGVEQYNANGVSAAVLLEDRQECRFPSSSGTHLIYSYEVQDPDGGGQWSTATMSGHDYLIADAIWWPANGGVYAHVSLTDGLAKDTPGVFLDVITSVGAPKAIITTARTAFLAPGTLEGFRRIRWAYLTGTSGNAAVPVTSTLTVYVDFDDAYGGAAPGAYNFATVLSTITFGAGMPVDLRMKLRRQKCKSVAFTFVDTPTITVPAGVNFQALALEVGIKRGVNRLPAAQSVG